MGEGQEGQKESGLTFTDITEPGEIEDQRKRGIGRVEMYLKSCQIERAEAAIERAKEEGIEIDFNDRALVDAVRDEILYSHRRNDGKDIPALIDFAKKHGIPYTYEEPEQKDE